MKRTSE